MKIFRGVLLIAFVFSLAKTAKCQYILTGLKGGLSIPNLSAGSTISGVSSGYQSISGPDLGIIGEVKLNEKLSLQAAVEWSTQGGQTKGVQSIPADEFGSYLPPGYAGQTVYAGFTGKAKLQYVMLPIVLKYYMNLDNRNRWRFYIDGGIFGAYMLKATGSVTGSSKIYSDREQTQPIDDRVITIDSSSDIKSRIHNGNFGITGDLGILYQLHRISVFAEVGGNYGFVNLQKPPSTGTSHTKAVVFRIGFMAPIKD